MSRNYTILYVSREEVHREASVHYNERTLLEVNAMEIQDELRERSNVTLAPERFFLRVDGVYDAQCFSGQTWLLETERWHTFHVTPHPEDESIAMLTVYT